ncbi:hypothetical protein CE91St50_31140 [Clostridioides difficile]|nr:hypothetical protein HMPREF1122_01090 [Clostridioides difficile 002-P50-2011]BDE80170.1 hypothetical protein CE91St50_31140 [Clostridioides difficile]
MKLNKKNFNYGDVVIILSMLLIIRQNSSIYVKNRGILYTYMLEFFLLKGGIYENNSDFK